MIKKNWVYIVFAISVLIFLGLKVYKSNNHNGQVELKVKTFHTDIGWGYDITANDTSLIHQDLIPGIEGRKGFNSKAEAEKVGTLVIEKIKNKKLPTVTLQELDDLKITK
jgi:hypothetical protein